MRRKIINGLYVGTVEDCEAVRGRNDWLIVHACKHPCHAAKCGGKVDKADPNYLFLQTSEEIFLNLIDCPSPIFPKELFDAFLQFVRRPSKRSNLLIHCNKGESRSPTLALLYLAKVTFRITNTSFDDAWDQFEALIGEKFTPGPGIEEWMRQHWDEFKIQGRPEKGPVADGIVDLELPSDPEELEKFVRQHPLVHFAGFTTIEDKTNSWVIPTPNVMQFEIDEVYDYCMAEQIPCRIMNLKPRQVGSSTKFGHLCWHHFRRTPSHVMIMGDVATRTEKVYGIFNAFATHDTFPWDGNYDYNTEKGTLRRRDGTEGLVEQATALDPKAGIAGTRQVVWLTEAARYKKNNGHDKKVVTAILNSLPNAPGTLGIAESTADGASGWFYDTWQKAVTLSQRKKGVVGNGWIKVFSPWFAFTEHKLERTPVNEDYFGDELSDRERKGITLYDWTREQIAWRRMKIANDCAGDANAFDQDFPEDAESCFLASGRPRFDMQSLSLMEKKAKLMHGTASIGGLQRAGERIAFVPSCDGGSWLWCIEPPTEGLEYIAFLDPMTGEQAVGSEDPDAHAAGIIRLAYRDDKGVWHNPRLVAVIDVPTGCRWEDELVGDRIRLLCDWYGGCMVVPETGNGLGAISQLKRAGCTIYQREKMDAMYPGKKLMVHGWLTNSDTRPMIVNEVANRIRDQSFDCEYLPAVSEMKTFIINSAGKAEAKSGCHDDWVLGIGIGLQCKDFASRLMPAVEVWRREAFMAVQGAEIQGGLTSVSIS